jgi:membrane protein YqaA with SNARE-associated domain
VPISWLAAPWFAGQYVRLVAHDLLAMLGLYGGTFAVAFIAGLVPLINAELFLVGLVRLAIDDSSQLAPLVVLAATGQMVAKIGLYHAGRGLLELPRGRYRKKILAARAKLEQWRSRPYLIYSLSASLGLPPFYLTVLAAGAMAIRFKAFLLIGLAGRLLRFAVIVALAWMA